MKINLIFGNRYHKEIVHKVSQPSGWSSEKHVSEKYCLEREEKNVRTVGKFLKGISNIIGG
jgi:hypothetical protein